MKVQFDSTGNFNNVETWLQEVGSRSPNAALNKLAIEGEQSLAANTPKDSGQTARGWKAKITTDRNGAEIAWVNNAHPESRINLAKVLDQGYATGTGGFVLPRQYIKKSMDKVFANVGETIVKEMIK